VEKVAPLAYWKLGNLLSNSEYSYSIRKRIVDLHGRLAADYYNSAAYNQLLFQEIGRFFSCLNREGIQAVLLKGAALAMSTYPDAALRPMGDVDMLVNSQVLEAVSTLIESLDYKKAIPELRGERVLDQQAFNHEVKLYGGPQDCILVELHWNLVGGDADRRSPALAWFRQETQPFVSPEGVQVNLFSPTANLLYQSAHLMLQHGEYRSSLLWFYDLHLLVNKFGDVIDWDAVPEICARFHWADAVIPALKGAQIRFGTELPEEIFERLEATSDPRTRRMVEINAVTPDERLANLLISKEAYDLPARIQMGIAHLFPRAAYMRWRYNPRIGWLWPLYYPKRWMKSIGYEFKVWFQNK
jgi:hypothetical protein